MPKQFLHVLTAERLSSDISKKGLSLLPPLRVLSREYGVSPVTMLKAVHELQNRGILEITHGRRISVARSRRDGATAQPETAAEALRERIAARISEGSYRVGAALPKVGFLALVEKVSTHTVCEALRLLEEQGLIRKDGKQRVIGPVSGGSKRDHAPSRIAARPTILLVCPRYEHWESHWNHRRILQFSFQFEEEVGRLNTAIVPVLGQGRHPSVPCPSGLREIRAKASALGENLRGVLVLGRKDEYPDLGIWIRELCRFHKPVVWLDTDDSGPEFDRKAIPVATYYRFRTDEKAMADLAVDRLYALGHRSLAASGCSRFGEAIWIPQRIARLKDAARRFDPPLTVVEAPQNEPWWVRLDPNVWSDTSMIDYIQAVRKNLALQAGRQGTHTLRKALMESVPSLASVVKGPCTAILPLNDWIAANDYHWFRGVGVSIPSELSLLSFDNERRWEFLPFSSIDFGLTDLGYLAAHVFVGDIPIACDRQGNVAGRPRLADRGSLGPARRK